MSANVESMFYTREKPWHGLGTMVQEAPASAEALVLAGLDWNVIQQPIQTSEGIMISGFQANIRETDKKVLGVVTNRYKVVQNTDAFAFTDQLLGEGVTYETAGSLQGGHRIWLLAKLPQRYIISGDELETYIVFMNAHDGAGGIKAAVTPIRVVCQNTLNLALTTAKRSWSANHTGNIEGKMEDARAALLYAGKYMAELGKAIDTLSRIKITDHQVYEYIDALFPLLEEPTEQQQKNLMRMKEDLKIRYFDAPDLKSVGYNGWRFVNSVSDFATHAKPIRERTNYKESLFSRTIEGNAMIDKAYELVMTK